MKCWENASILGWKYCRSLRVLSARHNFILPSARALTPFTCCWLDGVCRIRWRPAALINNLSARTWESSSKVSPVDVAGSNPALKTSLKKWAIILVVILHTCRYDVQVRRYSLGHGRVDGFCNRNAFATPSEWGVLTIYMQIILFSWVLTENPCKTRATIHTWVFPRSVAVLWCRGLIKLL